ncbi:AfsR/SARP family transcriptional regulator [Micromonospora sp. NPDC005113]
MSLIDVRRATIGGSHTGYATPEEEIMRFEVLGPLRAVNTSGSVVPAGRGQHQVVLACLVAARGQTVADSTLMEALWGRDPSNNKHGALRVLVHHLRRNLGIGSIIRADGGYRITLAGHQLDADEFIALVDAAAHDEAQGRLAEARQRYQAALRLWRGTDAYHGTADTDHVRVAANHLGEQRMTAYERCVDIELSLGLHRELRPELSAVATENAPRERLQAQLMLALVRSDRRAEALTVYERTRRILADELGADPGTRLQQLYTAILRGPRQRLCHPSPLPRSGRRSCPFHPAISSGVTTSSGSSTPCTRNPDPVSVPVAQWSSRDPVAWARRLW